MWKTPLKAFAIALLLGATLGGPAAAQGGGSGRGANGGISLDTAVARVRARTEARILAAETLSSSGGAVHVIRILTRKGKVRHIRIDADTGRVLSKH